MEKWIPYIVILLLTYLVGGFIRMQFNPAYWEKDARTAMIVTAGIIIVIYHLAKYMMKDMKE